jgi:WD40 repeat protein
MATLFPSRIRAITWISAQKLAVGCEDGTLYTQAVNEQQASPRAVIRHGDTILAVASSPDGARLATGGQDGFLKIWDQQTGDLLFSHAFTTQVTKVVFNQKGDRLLAIAGKEVWVWSVRRGQALCAYQKAFMHPTGVVDAAWSPEGDGMFLAAVCQNSTYCVWDADSRRGVFEGSTTGQPLSLAWTRQGVAVGTQRGDVFIYAASTGRNLLEHIDIGQPVTSLVPRPRPQNSALLVGTPVGIQILAAGLAAHPLGESKLPLASLALSQDGNLLAAGCINALRIWTLPTPQAQACPLH